MALHSKQIKEDILDQKSVHTKSVYTKSLSKIYQNYATLIAISMSKVSHGQKVQKVKKRASKRA